MAKGHCLCGQLSFETSAEPKWIAYCHCASCRRHTGSPVTCFVNVPLKSVNFNGKRSTYVSSPGVSRSFCASCGSPIAYEVKRRAGEIDLYINAFDKPEKLVPQLHVYTKERLPWFDVKDELPREE